MERGSKEWLDENYPIVEASKLSLWRVLKHKPQTPNQKWLKRTLLLGIIAGLKDFRIPAIAPSFEGEGIVDKAGSMPAVGKSCDWWYATAKKFMPEMNSRLGTEMQYASLIGVLIEYLVDERGYTVSDAWKAVCDNSEKLELAIHCDLEATGSRRLGLFYDLGNTCKILSNKKGYRFLFASCVSGSRSLASHEAAIRSRNVGIYDSVGWIVLDV